jgi:hypothetical protein
MEVGLHTRLLISASEVGGEPCTELFLGLDQPLGEVLRAPRGGE